MLGAFQHKLPNFVFFAHLRLSDLAKLPIATVSIWMFAEPRTLAGRVNTLGPIRWGLLPDESERNSVFRRSTQIIISKRIATPNLLSANWSIRTTSAK